MLNNVHLPIYKRLQWHVLEHSSAFGCDEVFLSLLSMFSPAYEDNEFAVRVASARVCEFGTASIPGRARFERFRRVPASAIK
jgi:hypothetical protein